MSTRLSPDAYLEHLNQDGGRLSVLGRSVDLGTDVPSCPGWTMHDLVGHCGEVYAHKTAALRLGRAPREGESATAPDRGEGQAVVDFHDVQLAELTKELAERGPDGETWTWFPGEHSTGFWFRRMAQEAMVHRVDGELAAGGLVGAVDPVLAADGVEEVLEWFAGHPGVLAHSASRAGAAGEVYVDAGDHAFVVELPDDGHAVREVDPLLGVEVAGTAGAVGAVLRGSAADLDLLLWGRPTTGEVAEEGDHDVLERLFSRLHLAVAD